MKAVYISLDVKLTGQRIHDVMKEQGYSVRQLQEKLDLTCPHAVYKWIHGSCIPSTDNLYRLSKILGVSMEICWWKLGQVTSRLMGMIRLKMKLLTKWNDVVGSEAAPHDNGIGGFYKWESVDLLDCIYRRIIR